MGLRQWWRGITGGSDPRLAEWRRAWLAVSQKHPSDERAVAALAERLEALGLAEDDVEVEREMLDALRQLAHLSSAVETAGLPLLETGHRVVARDICHFSAPVSMPDDPVQASGRLLLTNARAVFVGGAKATTLAWHGVAGVLQSDRDLVLIRRDVETLYRFRCNSYGDALCAAFLARRLIQPAQRGTAG
jgi:hypothetical protein